MFFLFTVSPRNLSAALVPLCPRREAETQMKVPCSGLGRNHLRASYHPGDGEESEDAVQLKEATGICWKHEEFRKLCWKWKKMWTFWLLILVIWMSSGKYFFEAASMYLIKILCFTELLLKFSHPWYLPSSINADLWLSLRIGWCENTRWWMKKIAGLYCVGALLFYKSSSIQEACWLM